MGVEKTLLKLNTLMSGLPQYYLTYNKDIKSVKDVNDEKIINDTRSLFFGMTYDCISQTYGNILLIQISEQEHKLIPNSSIHYKYLDDLSKFPESYLNITFRSLFLNIWSLFETSVSIIFNQLCGDKKSKIIKELNKGLTNKFKGFDKYKEIEAIINSKNEPFINIERKFRAITKGRRSNIDQFNEDLKFIELCSTYRNCLIHSNGMYYGKNKTFKFNQTLIIFNNNIPFYILFGYPELVEDITIELIEVFKRLCENIKDIDRIPNTNIPWGQ